MGESCADTWDAPDIWVMSRSIRKARSILQEHREAWRMLSGNAHYQSEVKGDSARRENLSQPFAPARAKAPRRGFARFVRWRPRWLDLSMSWIRRSS